MSYLYGYLGIGAAVLVVILVLLLTRKAASSLFRDLVDCLEFERGGNAARLGAACVLSLVFVIVLVVTWPVLVAARIHEWIGPAKERTLELGPPFAVERDHLQERLTVAQIEARERVSDPLGAVPNLPFGHLNAAWKDLINGLGGQVDELWSFTALSAPTPARKELRTGYVLVREGTPGNYILTLWKSLDP